VKRLALEYWTPLLVWILVIYSFSTDAFSSSETSRIIIPTLRFFFPRLTPSELNLWHAVVRKLAHIAEYFILTLLVYRSLKYEQFDPVQVKLTTITFVTLAAGLDELHQRFTAFRTPSPVDVAYDCFGAVCALWLITTYETWRLRTRSVL
jgi:VanZ family protein